ncbi:unnamed protein product [Adineta steineri]|uniref:Uncharacterized protein n=1 Tax=Adineta steineri TaxID=433720 RepID=A0A813R468_9BILA|nr:unnamed protein product [Adineta steineri]CAF0906687.1 unnamed protein product [Adineta steineri]
MSSITITTENLPTTNGLSLSSNNKLNELYSGYENHLSSCSSSPNSTCSPTMNFPEAQTSISKESNVKLPYPVLSDRRDSSSILSLLQKETQATSKKILDVTQLIETYEKNLTSNRLSESDRKSFKYERDQRKQQLDALKKHERRVNLQIDYITTKTEIRGLEDEQKQNSDKNKQIEVLLRKLKQKLDQMKIYMKKRNEEMKKIHEKKEKSSTSNDNRKQLSSDQKIQQRSSSSDLTRKRPLPFTNKQLKSTTHNHAKPPVVRLASRSSNQQTKSQPPPLQTPTVRFLKKTTDSTMSTINSASPTTPASSSSTLSPPLIASTSTEDANNISKQNTIPSIDEDDEFDVQFDIEELFDDDPYSEKSIKRFKSDKQDYKPTTES